MAESQAAFASVLKKLEVRLAKVDQVQGSRVKLPKAEIELLEQILATRDALAAMLGDKTSLPIEISVLARVRVVLESVKLSQANESDARLTSCMAVVDSCEKVLKNSGVGGKTVAQLEKELEEALEKEKRALSERRSSIRLKDVHEAVSVAIKIKKMIATQQARRDMIPGIVEEMDLAALLTKEPSKRDALAAWMVWMVHRAHLNDPLLDVLDFSNLQMPHPVRTDGFKDSRAALLAPKLVKAMASNTFITTLKLANCNLQGPEGVELGEALKKNTTIRRLNIDSNMLAPADLEAVIQGLKENTTIEEFRCNNQLICDIGRSSCSALENLLEAVQTNTRIVKLGLHIQEAHFNNEISKQLMKNNQEAKAYNKTLVLESPVSEGLGDVDLPMPNMSASLQEPELDVKMQAKRRATLEIIDAQEANEIERMNIQAAADLAREVAEFGDDDDNDSSGEEWDPNGDSGGADENDGRGESGYEAPSVSAAISDNSVPNKASGDGDEDGCHVDPAPRASIMSEAV
mmetsp:Transcript_137177/g.273720  ORF Transcript_137177/g.273720 Transcript_137177/m.273720 type:complete len:519 (+) Transcript_137177:97-1653(+)